MAFKNEPCSSVADFIDKANTFLVSAGWTSDRNVPGSGEWAMNRGGEIRFSAQYDTATPGNLGLYQYLGAYNTGVAPYAQADDSGNGAQSTTNSVLDDARHVPITNTPLQYWCFTTSTYAHFVIEVSSGNYVHWGCGQLTKFGNWTGGEYVYGFRQESGFSTGVTTLTGSQYILDGLVADSATATPTNMEQYCATVHVESLPSQVAGGKYAVFMGNQASGDLGNDRQASPKGRAHFTGGFRGGPIARPLARIDGSDLAGHLPMYPIVALYFERTSGNFYGPMGTMTDVRGVSIKNYVGGQELTIGGDTWIIFPPRKKWISGAFTGQSGYLGIMYKKIV